MSGGVDSSVAAALLRDEGYEVVGCFMRLGSPGESLEDDGCEADGSEGAGAKIGHQGCCSINDAKDAQGVAAMLDIPLYVLNFKEDFGRVIDYFVAEYNAGRTPNPCVRCNDWLKFGRLAAYARSIDADWVASGHYARVGEHGGKPALLRGVDAGKDQSYVLFGIDGEALERTLLPVGGYQKDEIRQIARELGLGVSDKPDSQEICFVPLGDYRAVVAQRAPAAIEPGVVRDMSGEAVGAHPGHQHFTIGQRRGLGLALGDPAYVVEKDAASNTVTIGSRADLATTVLRADQANWLDEEPRGEARRCAVKVRYNAVAAGGWVRALAGGRFEVQFDEPQFAVAPGQAAVCYEDDRVLGGGWIC